MTSGRVITDMARGIGEAVYVTTQRIQMLLRGHEMVWSFTVIKAQRGRRVIREYLES